MASGYIENDDVFKVTLLPSQPSPAIPTTALPPFLLPYLLSGSLLSPLIPRFGITPLDLRYHHAAAAVRHLQSFLSTFSLC